MQSKPDWEALDRFYMNNISLPNSITTPAEKLTYPTRGQNEHS